MFVDGSVLLILYACLWKCFHTHFCCVVESNRHVLVEAGAVELFAQLLSSSDQDIQFYCAAALSNLAVHGKEVGQGTVLSGELGQGVGHSKEGAKGGG